MCWYSQLINKFDKGICFLLCAIDIISKYTWVVSLKDKKVIIISNAFQTLLTESNCRLNKVWADIGSELYKRSMKSWLQNNNIEMYLTHEGESVVAKSFIRTLKNKIYKYMTLILKNVYTDKLDNVFNEYSNTYKYIQQYIYIYIYIYSI